jgi:SHS2 domain-containing protein
VKEASFEIIEHTADIGIRVKSSTLAGLFKCAGLAIAEISIQKQKTQYPKRHKIVIRQKADNLEELFVNWLNELLSVSAVETLVFEDIQVNQITENSLDAIAIGSDIRNYKINTEIKAATYHQLRVRKSGRIWQAEVIFDV